jgi:hypothetical protein
LRQKNIPTLVPVAIVERRFGFFRGTAYFISEYVTGIRGCDYFNMPIADAGHWGKVIENILSMIRLMRAALVEHNDFQYGNLLIVDDQPLLLDLEHMKIYKRDTRYFQRVFQRDLKYFLHFLQPNKPVYQVFSQVFAEFLTD